jgi:DNA polymerase
MLTYRTAPLLWTVTTDYPSIDFETFSAAGYYRDDTGKVHCVIKNKTGISAVGAAAYAEHPSCDALCLAYNLKDGQGEHIWLPYDTPPFDLWNYVAQGGILQAWHSYFEYKVWNEKCVPIGWPPLPFEQLRDCAAKARAFSLPGKLAHAAIALGTEQQKGDGSGLIKLFSIPQSYTAKDRTYRKYPHLHPKGSDLYGYCLQDIRTESDISSQLPDLSPFETKVFLLDQKINERGVRIDTSARDDLHAVVCQAVEKYTSELVRITGGALASASEIQKTLNWLHDRGVHLDNLDAETVDAAIGTLGNGTPKRVLEIRQLLSSASVKKLPAMMHQASADGRIRELFTYCGADRTGRYSAGGVQPHNLPSGGATLMHCSNGCEHYYGAHTDVCPWCGLPDFMNADTPTPKSWTANAIEDVLTVARHRSLDMMERYFGDAITAVQGCLRGLFIPSEGCRFICSDFSAIEAVVTAAMAGEEWRLEVFRTHGMIYEESASRISGVPFEEFIEHKKRTGEHHPLRKKLGKVAELASGYKGWIGAWKKFGADKYFKTDDEIKQAILKWRSDNPRIVNFWDSVEQAFYFAVNNPSERYQTHGLYFGMEGNRLFVQLPSGRKLVYAEPWASREENYWGRYDYTFTYMRWNKSKKKGPVNKWIRVDTWIGEIIENFIQAISRDILCHSLLNLERAGYPIVLHVHDEACADVPFGFGSVEHFEQTANILPDWCKDWPIRMKGGWEGPRFKKDG